MAYIEVVTAPGFGEVLVSIVEIPLTDAGAPVVARRRGRKQTIHCQEAGTNVVDAQVAANAHLLQLDFAVPEAFRRAPHRVISGLVVTLNEVGVYANFRREILGSQRRILRAWSVVLPRIIKRKWR